MTVRPDVRNGAKADAACSTLAPARQQDQDEADEGEDRAADDPRPLIDHEARCRPMDQPGALPDPQQPDQQAQHTEDKQSGLHCAAVSG